MYVSRDILEGMESAEHFKKVVGMTKTGLAEVLHKVQDHVFTVQFRRQPTAENVEQVLINSTRADSFLISALSKTVLEGSLCKMVCYMLNTENGLGRSVVVDLNATLRFGSEQKAIRQIDHRSIEYIVCENVKYELKKSGKGKGKTDDGEGKDDPRK